MGKKGATPDGSMTSAKRSERLRRFDDVFRTLLVITSILVSGAIAFYKDILPSQLFPPMILFFVLAICIWALATLLDGTGEAILKIAAWYNLMSAFVATVTRLIFYSTYTIPKGGLAILAVTGFSLSYPMFGYLKDLSEPRDQKILMVVLVAATAFLIVTDVIF